MKTEEKPQIQDSPLETFRCHKVVRAMRIRGIRLSDESDELIGDNGLIVVSREYIEKHGPQVGGYYVVYKDGYKSYSPCDAFEDGYSPHEGYDMGWALQQLKAGKRVGRVSGSGGGNILELQVPDEHSKMTLPYVYARTIYSDLVPWQPSQIDLLANDWYVIDENENAVNNEG